MVALNIALLMACIAGAFFCAGTETGFISWNPMKVMHRARQGDFAARWAHYLMRHKGRVVSSVLIGNNICIVGATLAFLYLFAQLDARIDLNLSRIPSPESWLLSPLLVVFGEMLPKSLFRIYSFRLTIRAIPMLTIGYWITWPLNLVFDLLGSLAAEKNIPSDESYRTRVREEMLLVASEGARRGTIFENANVLINGVMRLKDKTISSAAIPLEVDRAQRLISSDTVARAAGVVKAGDSEVPVFSEQGSVVQGYVSVLDIAAAEKSALLHSVMKPVKSMKGDTPVLQCLKKVQKGQSRFYRIVDKHGQALGVFDRNRLRCMAFAGI